MSDEGFEIIKKKKTKYVAYWIRRRNGGLDQMPLTNNYTKTKGQNIYTKHLAS